MDCETLRESIPAVTDCTYLNWGASGPSPRSVVDAATEFERHHQFRAPAREGMYEAAMETTEETRESVAGLLETSKARVALTHSTADGINHVAGAIDWQEGDVVLRTDAEHSAARLPWQRLRQTAGIEVRTLETTNGRIDTEELKSHVRDARLVCCNSPTWNYGTHQPVGEIVDIAHDAGARVLVDAVQAPGQTRLEPESWGADFVAASGHKWLLGLWGAGFLYVDDRALEDLTPHRVGYFSVDSFEDTSYELYSDARRFELGTRSIGQLAALTEAIDLVESIGIDTIEQRIARLSGRLREGLGDRLRSPADGRTGLVTFDADEPEQLVSRLAAQDVQIRWVPEPYACRASVHAFNTEADIDHLLDAVEEAT